MSKLARQVFSVPSLWCASVALLRPVMFRPLAFAFLLAMLSYPAPLARGGETAAAEDRDFFERQVRPLFVRRCHECHSGSAKTLKGGLRLDRGESVRAGGDSGPLVVPGNPAASLLIAAVRHTGETSEMPPAGKLPDAEIEILVRWVERGAFFFEAEPMATTKRARVSIEEGRKFWSFQPLARPQVALSERSWPSQQPADLLVQTELRAQGLAPSRVAEARVLIRRVALDLTGLPPAPDEVERFVADSAPDAYERLVDQLIASPRFGERWGRFWLDLARYTDKTEVWLKSTAHASLYRDWVVAALNEDVPYDQFVRRQLATDLLPDSTPTDYPALGFLGLSPTYWKELRLAPEVIQGVVAEEWEERIDAIGRTFLGLTVACARCHDHKSDPIRVEDYYALAGVMANVRLVDRPMLPAPESAAVQDAREEVAAIEEQLDPLRKQAKKTDETEQKIAELESRIQAIRAAHPKFDVPVVNAVEDAALDVLPDGPELTRLVNRRGEARDIAIQIRGNPANRGPLAPRRFLEVLSPPGEPRPFREGSGRRELADALFHEGGPLVARVIANRVWGWHFGRGLVDTPSDFGTLGARPTHPALLEFLASELVADQWSLKQLHRRIVTSATYRQASLDDAGKRELDPENRWLWRMNRRRLEVEAWRDAMLVATGTLDARLGGPAIELDDPGNRRRTLYGVVYRRELHDLLKLHDFPDPTGHNPTRDATTTPLQQLFALNGTMLHGLSHTLAARIEREGGPDVAGRVRAAYGWLFSREPTAAQIALAERFLASATTPEAQQAAWRQYAHALLCSNELQLVD